MVTLASIKEVENHRNKICIEKICEFLRQQEDQERSIKDISLYEYQTRVSSQIKTLNESVEYEKYRRKYREIKKSANLSKKDV